MRNKEALKILKRLKDKVPVDDVFDLNLLIDAIEYEDKLNRFMMIFTLGIFTIGCGFLIGFGLGKL